jgi:hypothetical protein
MPAKKKRTETFELLESRCSVFESRAYKAEAKVVELTEKLSIAQTFADRHLREIHDLVEAKRKDNASAQAEIEYWMAEVNRLHYELIDIQREAARDGVG